MDYRSDGYNEWGDDGGSGAGSNDDGPAINGTGPYYEAGAGSAGGEEVGAIWQEPAAKERPATQFLTNKMGVSLLFSSHIAIITSIALAMLGAGAAASAIATFAMYVFAYVLLLSYMTEGGAERIAKRMGGERVGARPDLPPPDSVVSSLPIMRSYLIVTRVPLWVIEMPHGLTIAHLEKISIAIEHGRIPGGIASGRILSELKIGIPRDRRSRPNAGEILEFLTRAGIAEKGTIYYVINKAALDRCVKFTKEWDSPSPIKKR